MTDGTVIVGGGLAGQRCAEALRRAGHEARIRIVCGEALAPYDRPPLSKELLAASLAPGQLALRPGAWYADNDVELLLGEPAAGLDPGRRRLLLGRGAHLRYDHLLIATGSEPRALGLLAPYRNVSTLRTLPDAQTLRGALRPGARLAVVGAGFIGLEVAATARGLGAQVTVIEAARTPLAAVLGPALGRWFVDLHRAEGADFLLSAKLVGARGDAGRVEELVLGDGRVVGCDHVLVAVGVAPATSWLSGSGLDAEGGVVTDAAGRTACPQVFAAGDAARAYDPLAGEHVRCEHWEAAARLGAAAGRAMLGIEPAVAPPASFWSDQYGVRIQYLGEARGADSVELDGDPASRDFAAVYTRRSQAVAALLVGRPGALPDLRRRIAAGLRGLNPATPEGALT